MGAGAAALGAVLYPGPSATAEPLQNPTSTPAEKGRAHTQLGLPQALPIWSPRYPQRVFQAVSHSPCVRSSLHIATRRSLCTKATRRVFGGQTFDCSLFGFGCCVVIFFFLSPARLHLCLSRAKGTPAFASLPHSQLRGQCTRSESGM